MWVIKSNNVVFLTTVKVTAVGYFGFPAQNTTTNSQHSLWTVFVALLGMLTSKKSTYLTKIQNNNTRKLFFSTHILIKCRLKIILL